MKSERLTYRLRTTELMKQVLNMDKADQMKFFGMNDDLYLATELSRASKRIKTNREIDWRIFELIDNTNQVVGNCGYHTWWLDHDRAEIGYWLNEQARGKGYMTEALKAIMKYGFESMNLHRIEAMISPENLASRKLVEALGFNLEGKMRENHQFNGKFQDSVIYGLIKQ